MAVENIGRTVYMRHTNTSGGAYVQEHRVWDFATFLGNQFRTVTELNSDAVKKKQPANAKIEQITEDQYRKEKTK